MDPTAIITGVVTGVAVAWVSFQLGRSLERERWDRDDRIRREDREREARERWSSERRQLFGRFLRAIERLRDISRSRYDGTDPGGWETPWNDGHLAIIEIALIDPDLEPLADAVYEQAGSLAASALHWMGTHHGMDPPVVEERERPLNDAIDAFVKAAQARLQP